MKTKLTAMLLAAGAMLGLLTATSLTAYGDTLTVHDGTATSDYVPVYGYNADAYLKCEYVLPASELAAMNGQGIFDMTWYLSTPAPGPWTGTFQVFLKEVSDTAISAYTGTDGATVVYEGTLDGRAAALKVEFSTPYLYNGGNLLVGVYQIVKGSYSSAAFLGETVNGASVQGWHGSSIDSAPANQRNFLPKTTITYGPVETVSVTFDENFAGGSTTNMNILASGKVLAKAPKAAERDGWMFAGWFTAATDGEQISADDLPTDGATYYAHWTKAVTIGSPDSTNTAIPTFFNAGYSLTQQIYAPGEIGAACTLYGIAFKKNVGSKTSTRGLDVYLVHTAKSSFSGGNDWIPVAAADKVFGGGVTFATGEWTIIRFGKAFEYNGTENLAVIVDDNTGVWVSDGTSFCTFDAPGMALNVYSDSTDYNPANPSGYSGSVRNVKNHICLLTEPCGIPVWDGNLATLTTGATAFDGMVVFGELAGYPKKISIADGATVTISNVTLNSGASNYNSYHAGINCDGDAVIVLKGESSIRGFASDYPGIFVPAGKTLTIRGDGSLAAGVCSSSHAAAIGGGYKMACGSIVIEDGNITATGGRFAPGIGGGPDGNSCGDIIIDGGSVTAIAADGGYTAAIGSGSGCNCGDITIGAGIVSVTAFTSSATPPIGAGADGVPGTITIAPGLDDSTIYSGGYTRTIIPWDGNLATLSGNVVVSNGMTITGTLTGNHKVSIADGATVTLDGASINADGAVTFGYYAGITCNGDATIVLKGENAVKGFNASDPGIYVPYSSTVTIQGEGALDVSSNGTGAGIAVGNGSTLVVAGGVITATGGKNAAGIAVGNGSTLVVEDGVITATGGENAAGIGGGNYITSGNISIVGGTVTATGGSNAPGIGSGRYGSFGTITIANTVTCVTAIKGVNAPESIGTAADASCGTVTIGGAVGAIAESPYAYCPAADMVVAQIDAIGEVVYADESKAKIDAARAAYDALTPAQQALVGNYATLTAAEAAYGTLKAAADAAAADAAAAAAAVAAIDAIGDVAYTDESKGKIDAARAAYDALTPAQQALVANAATLTAAEETYANLKAAADNQVAADAVIAAIDAIGEVTYTDASKAKIDAARAAYDALTPAQQALVANAATLTAAEAAYGALKAAADAAAADAAAAAAAVAAIDAIGDVAYTDESKGKIDAARAAYDALTPAQQALVANAATLTAAEETYANLKAAADNQVAADAVIAAISAIGDVTYTDESKAKIDAARAEYDALTPAQQALVGNYATLTAAETTYAALAPVPPVIEPIVEPVPPCYEALGESDITAPYAAAKAVTLYGAVYDGCDLVGVMELKLGKVNVKKKTGKVSGTLTDIYGKKHKIGSKKLTGIDGESPQTVSLEVKDYGTMTVAIGGTQFAGTMGRYHVQSENVGNDWGKGTATVKVSVGDLSKFTGTVIEELLPTDGVKGSGVGKWSFDKGPSVKWAKVKAGTTLRYPQYADSGKGLVVGEGSNPSSLKLTYTPKKGTFKGSFKVYALEGEGTKTKLKKYTIKVNGVVVNGVGYGTATCKKPAVTWDVRVE